MSNTVRGGGERDAGGGGLCYHCLVGFIIKSGSFIIKSEAWFVLFKISIRCHV